MKKLGRITAVVGIAIILCIMLAGCEDEEATNKVFRVQGVEFSIISVSTLRSVKRMVDVRLSQRVSEGVLRTMGQELYVPGYDRTFICYWLPHMEAGSGAYATTHWNPFLEVRMIFGMTPKRLQFLVDLPLSAMISPQEVIGQWFYEFSESSYRITIHRRYGVLYMERMFLDGSYSKDKLIEGTSSQGRRFEDGEINYYGEYYLLDKHGDLHMGDEEGLFEKFQKIR